MAQRAGRIPCPRCGANNFDTVTSCWKCGTALGTPASAAPMVSPVASVPLVAPPAERPVSSPPPSPAYAPAAYGPAVSGSAPPSGDSGLAKRAAFWLGVTFPWLGLPIGWVFMMIEDSRKQAIGRVCAGWSLLGLVLHLFLFYVMAQYSMRIMVNLLVPLMKAGAAGSGRGGGETNLPSGYNLPQ